MRPRIFAAFLLLACWGTARAARPALYVNLRVSVEAQAGAVTLGRLAAVTSEDPQLADRARAMAVASAPFPGTQVSIDRQTIADRLAVLGIAAERLRWGGAHKVALTTRSVRVSSTELLNVARQHLVTSLPGPDAAGEWAPLAPPGDRVLVAGDSPPRLSALPLGVRPGAGVVRTFVRIVVDGEDRATVPVVFKKVEVRHYVVAARDISAGHLIQADDVELRSAPVGSPDAPPRACASLDDAVGRVAGRMVRAGQPLSPNILTRPLLVRKGESININVVRGPLEVVSKGLALADGREDEVINVRVASTSKVVQARVKAPGEVDVSL